MSTPPILHDFPDEFESERLLIRAPRPGDGETIYAAITESREHLHPWMPWADAAQSAADQEAWVRAAHARFLTREDLPLLLFRKADGLFIGGSGLHRIDWTVPRFEVGYWVRVSEQGKGYITEATHAIVDFAFGALEAQRVEIRMDSHNERSAAVPQRLGLTLEGTLRHNRRNPQGHLCSTLVYAVLREEWVS